ncbi:hypothetical protein ABW19_dt0202836 [Dactylella cylindrospora]|nr:hypothetical protein ABW19_dt0202836 [Dactylella cylindrospora]
MFAHSAESNIRAASTAFSTVAKTFGWFQESTPATLATSSSGAPAAALPAAQAAPQSGGWGWAGKLAMAAGVAATVSAGATAAYYNRDNITQGYSWVTSHLQFVGVLFKNEDLKTRVTRACSVPGVGIANFYTVLGEAAKPSQSASGKPMEVGGQGLRTFCSLPPKPANAASSSAPSSPSRSGAASPDQRAAADIDLGSKDMRGWWHAQLNDMATDEVNAHMFMFGQKTNSGYKEMMDGTRKQIMKWAINWYDSRV